MATQQDKRQAARKTFTTAGHLYTRDGTALSGCLDVSAHGARIAVGSSGQIPDEVTVMLSRDGSVRRHGKVVWRMETGIGIRFGAQKPAK